jgi:molybdopterin synthase catalytic subunit
MANSVSRILVTEVVLRAPDDDDVDPSTSLRTSLAAGAIVDFWGVVRQLEDEREIEGIDYEAHATMAEHQMKLLADTAAEKFQLRRVLLHHRTGFVPAGEASLFLRVCAGHRGEAFDASEWIVEELKKKVPIWKKPRFKSDQSEVGSARCAVPIRV